MGLVSNVRKAMAVLALTTGLSLAQNANAQTSKASTDRLIMRTYTELRLQEMQHKEVARMPSLDELTQRYELVANSDLEISPDSISYQPILQREFHKPESTPQHNQLVHDIHAHQQFFFKIGKPDFIQETFEKHTGLPYPKDTQEYAMRDLFRLNKFVTESALTLHELAEKHPQQHQKADADSLVQTIQTYSPHTGAALENVADVRLATLQNGMMGLYDVAQGTISIDENLSFHVAAYTLLHELGHATDNHSIKEQLQQAIDLTQTKDSLDNQLRIAREQLEYAQEHVKNSPETHRVAHVYANDAREKILGIRKHLHDNMKDLSMSDQEIVRSELIAELYAQTAIHEIAKNNKELAQNILSNEYQHTSLYGLSKETHHAAHVVGRSTPITPELVTTLNELQDGVGNAALQRKTEEYTPQPAKQREIMYSISDNLKAMMQTSKHIEQQFLAGKDLKDIREEYETLFTQYVQAHRNKK